MQDINEAIEDEEIFNSMTPQDQYLTRIGYPIKINTEELIYLHRPIQNLPIPPGECLYNYFQDMFDETKEAIGNKSYDALRKKFMDLLLTGHPPNIEHITDNNGVIKTVEIYNQPEHAKSVINVIDTANFDSILKLDWYLCCNHLPPPIPGHEKIPIKRVFHGCVADTNTLAKYEKTTRNLVDLVKGMGEIKKQPPLLQSLVRGTISVLGKVISLRRAAVKARNIEQERINKYIREHKIENETGRINVHAKNYEKVLITNENKVQQLLDQQKDTNTLIEKNIETNAEVVKDLTENVINKQLLILTGHKEKIGFIKEHHYFKTLSVILPDDIPGTPRVSDADEGEWDDVEAEDAEGVVEFGDAEDAEDDLGRFDDEDLEEELEGDIYSGVGDSDEISEFPDETSDISEPDESDEERPDTPIVYNEDSEVDPDQYPESEAEPESVMEMDPLLDPIVVEMVNKTPELSTDTLGTVVKVYPLQRDYGDAFDSNQYFVQLLQLSKLTQISTFDDENNEIKSYKEIPLNYYIKHIEISKNIKTTEEINTHLYNIIEDIYKPYQEYLSENPGCLVQQHSIRYYMIKEKWLRLTPWRKRQNIGMVIQILYVHPDGMQLLNDIRIINNGPLWRTTYRKSFNRYRLKIEEFNFTDDNDDLQSIYNTMKMAILQKTPPIYKYVVQGKHGQNQNLYKIRANVEVDLYLYARIFHPKFVYLNLYLLFWSYKNDTLLQRIMKTLDKVYSNGETFFRPNQSRDLSKITFVPDSESSDSARFLPIYVPEKPQKFINNKDDIIHLFDDFFSDGLLSTIINSNPAATIEITFAGKSIKVIDYIKQRYTEFIWTIYREATGKDNWWEIPSKKCEEITKNPKYLKLLRTTH